MKTPEEWLKEWSFFEKIPTRELSAIIKEAQKEAWNEALDWAASKVYPVSNNGIDEVHAERIKESILKGKK